MNYIAGVEIPEAFGDVGQLVTGVSARWTQRRDTYESKSVRIGIIPEVLRQVPAGHPIRDELEGSDSDT